MKKVNMVDLVRRVKAAKIVGERRPQKQKIVRAKHFTKWSPGKCLICNEAYDLLSYVHAEKHGFASPEEMIEKGVCVPLSEYDCGVLTR